MIYEKILPSQEPEYRMAYTRKFLLALESVCEIDDHGNVIIPHSQVNTFYEELRRCQEMMQIGNDDYSHNRGCKPTQPQTTTKQGTL